MNRTKQALEIVQSQPVDALRLAEEVLADPSITDEERASAAWALGRAHSELNHIDLACKSLEDGLATAVAAGLDELGAEIEVSLSVCRLTAGETEAAKTLLANAAPHLEADGSLGRLYMQHGLVDLHLGDLDSAIAHFDQAYPYLERGADELARARLLVNRGVVHTMTGDLDRAEDDLVEAQLLAESLDQHMLSAGASQNLGFVAGRKGDVRSALSWFDRARSGYERLGSPRRVMVTLEGDLCTVLLSGGLYDEATVSARRAVAMAAQDGNRLAEAEALLLLARACVAKRSYEAAEHHAAKAAEIFDLSERTAWVAMADYVGLLAAAVQATDPDEGLLARANDITERLLASGWLRDSLEVRTFAGRTALALGRTDEARTQLGRAAEARHSGSSSLRASAWLATANLHLADGDRAGAKRAVSTGMSIVEEHRASLSSTELRVHASINGAELAEFGLRLAVEDGDPVEVLDWAERWHAGGFHVGVRRPDPQSRLARALVELRQASVATIEGGLDPLGENDDPTIARLEREIRDLSRRTEGSTAMVTGRAGVDRLRSRVGADVMIEYFTIGGNLTAAVINDHDITVHHIGPLTEVANTIRMAGSAMSRLAFGSATEALAQATLAAVRKSAALIEEVLLGGLQLADTGDIIIVPTGPLQSLPWALLPKLADRTVTVTPSGSLWAEPEPRPDPATELAPEFARARGGQGSVSSVLLVCGDGLPGGDAEIALLQTLHDDPVVLVGADATVPNVLRAMEQADIVHLAAHGIFRADNPMFSALSLHDGPLTVYDIESLVAAPTTVILPACDAARSSVRGGDELLGTASALLQVGVRTVIAPTSVVPDSVVVPPLMLELHRSMLAGNRPDEALVEARRSVQERDTSPAATTASSFIAIGTCNRP